MYQRTVCRTSSLQRRPLCYGPGQSPAVTPQLWHLGREGTEPLPYTWGPVARRDRSLRLSMFPVVQTNAEIGRVPKSLWDYLFREGTEPLPYETVQHFVGAALRGRPLLGGTAWRNTGYIPGLCTKHFM